MAQIVDRDAAQVNQIEQNVYIHQGFRDHAFAICCFKDMQYKGVEHMRRFHRHHFYTNMRSNVSTCFVTIPRILYLGQFQNPDTMVADVRRYFSGLNEFGYHLFLTSDGLMACTYCYSISNKTNFVDTLRMTTVNDIFPRFYHRFDSNRDRLGQPMLTIARKYQITNFEDQIDMLCCNSTHAHIFQHMANKYSALLDHLWCEAFGIYVCKGAKLVVSEQCRRCEATKPVKHQHHIRTVVMSGGFVFIEGSIVFQFATNQFVCYTKEQLEMIEELNIPVGTITRHNTPIFFLNAVQSQHDSLCWALQFDNQTLSDQWVLIMPQNGSFEVHSYDTGICGVMSGQYDEPWHESGDHYIERIPNYTATKHYGEHTHRHPRTVWTNRYQSVIINGVERQLTVRIANTRPPPQTFQYDLHAFPSVRHACIGNYTYRTEYCDRRTGCCSFRLTHRYYPQFLANNTPFITHAIKPNVSVREYNIDNRTKEYVLCLTNQFAL